MSWFTNNYIAVNYNKTKLICFCDPHKQVTLDVLLFLHAQHCGSCNCRTLEKVKAARYLLHFDENVPWSDHVDHFIQKFVLFQPISLDLRAVATLISCTRYTNRSECLYMIWNYYKWNMS